MALKFLNKKGWHTGSLRNIENVWKAEQKKEAEERKFDELRKQIHQEKEQLEFRKLQEQAGLIPKQERLDFLYESGLGVGKPSENSEEYLLGKPLEESKEGNVLQQVAAQPGSLFVEEKTSANDQWRKIRSDPLLLIKQQELAARERIKNNPLKMEALRKEVEIKKKEKEERKRLKKEEKKKKKALKKKMKMKDKDEDEVSDEHHSGRDRKRARHDSPDSDDDKGPRKDDMKRDSRDRSPRKRTRHDSPDSDGKDDMKSDSRKRTRHDGLNSDNSRERSGSPRRSPSPRKHEGRTRGRSPRRSEDRRDRSPKRSLSPSSTKRTEGRRDSTEDRRRDRSPGRYENRRRDSSPRKYEDRRRNVSQDEENSRAFGKPPLPARKKVKPTEEEIAARLKEMQQDAELHEEQRWQRLKTASVKDAIEEQRDGVRLSKNFLDEASRSIYGTEDNGKVSVADTVHRRSHYREKFTDTNAFRRT